MENLFFGVILPLTLISSRSTPTPAYPKIMTRKELKKTLESPDRWEALFALIEFVLAFIAEHNIKKDIKLSLWNFIFNKDLRNFTLTVIKKVLEIVGEDRPGNTK